MIYRPSWINAFEFAVVAARRTEQLRRGCLARIEGDHKLAVTAQLEVIAGKVARVPDGIQGSAKGDGLSERPEALPDPAAVAAPIPAG